MPPGELQNEVILIPQLTLGTLKKVAESAGFRLTGQGLPPKLNEYELFLDFCTTPYPQRPLDELTERDFCGKYGVSQMTLWRWKQRKGFKEELRGRNRAWGCSRIADVLYALYVRCIRHGRAQDVALFLEYVEGWSPRSSGQKDPDEQEEYTIDDIRYIIGFLPPEDQKEFNETIIKIYQKAVECTRRRDFDEYDH